MALIGRMHPLLVHFPIALVFMALAAEGAARLARDSRWRIVAVTNVRLAALFAVAAAVAGWRFAAAAGDTTPMLEWHRWLAIAGCGATVAAAASTWSIDAASRAGVRFFLCALVCAAALVGAASHLGGLLVWGADFLRP